MRHGTKLKFALCKAQSAPHKEFAEHRNDIAPIDLDAVPAAVVQRLKPLSAERIDLAE